MLLLSQLSRSNEEELVVELVVELVGELVVELEPDSLSLAPPQFPTSSTTGASPPQPGLQRRIR